MDKLAAQKAIDEILYRFDFELVQQYMTAVNWAWAGGVPSLQRIKEMALHVLQTAINEGGFQKDHRRVSCGGFTARIDRWEPNGPYRINLQFIPFHVEVSI